MSTQCWGCKERKKVFLGWHVGANTLEVGVGRLVVATLRKLVITMLGEPVAMTLEEGGVLELR